ncbi:MAG: hypothetical protein R3F60_16280 [bacterium]
MHTRMYFAAALVLTACGGESDEAARAPCPVVVDTGALVTAGPTDLGYTTTLTRARAVLHDVQLARGGESHTRNLLKIMGLGVAYAHPGHLAGGDVLGELPGRFVVDLAVDGSLLGEATVVLSEFDSLGFGFGQGTEADGLAADDPLVGHTLELAGAASRDGRTVTFHAVIDQDLDRVVVGIPFQTRIDTAGTRVGFGLLGEGLFDGVDFFALAGDADDVALDAAAIAVLRRSLQSHEHFAARTRPPEN